MKTISLLALAALLSACSTSPPLTGGLATGSTKQEVIAQLGPPLRTTSHPDGSETWYYNTSTSRSSVSYSDNYTLPAESISERDLRYEFEGISSSASLSKEMVETESPIAFSPAGTLTSAPNRKFLPNR